MQDHRDSLIHSDEEYLVVTRIMSIFAPVNIHQRANTYINMANDKNYIQPTASTSDVAMTLDQLADRILFVDETFRQQAAHAVNCMLTARNWFIGFYIVEFEQHGADRAQYGEQLLKTLAKRINRKGMDWRSLYDFRTFYNVYPQLQSEIFPLPPESDARSYRHFCQEIATAGCNIPNYWKSGINNFATSGCKISGTMADCPRSTLSSHQLHLFTDAQ